MTMSLPRVARRCGIAARLIATTPKKLTSMLARSPSIVLSSSVGLMPATPALFTTASSRPCMAMTERTHSSTDSGSVSSRLTTSTDTPAFSAASRNARSPSGRRTVATVVSPAWAAATAVARPIPEEAPVTSTVLMTMPPSLRFAGLARRSRRARHRARHRTQHRAPRRRPSSAVRCPADVASAPAE